MSYIGWVQAGGAWALRVLSFLICPRVCLLLMHLPRLGDSPSVFPGLSCGFSFGFSLHSGAGLRMMMGLTLLWPTFDFLYCLPCLNCYSCRNNLILLDLFFGPAVYPFSQWPVMGTVLLLLIGSYVPLGIHGLIAFFGLPRPVY